MAGKSGREIKKMSVYDKPADLQKLIEKAGDTANQLAELELNIRATLSTIHNMNQEMVALRDELDGNKVVCAQCGTANLRRFENCINCGRPL